MSELNTKQSVSLTPPQTVSVVWRLVVVIVRKISSDAEMCVEFLGVRGLNCYVVFSLNTKQSV